MPLNPSIPSLRKNTSKFSVYNICKKQTKAALDCPAAWGGGSCGLSTLRLCVCVCVGLYVQGAKTNVWTSCFTRVLRVPSSGRHINYVVLRFM